MLTILFLHGWGFDSSIWDGMAARLRGFAHAFADRGYFGRNDAPVTEGPVLAVAHSFGAMRLLGDVPDRCIGLVAINGFDRFAGGDGFPGVPTRLLDRMIDRFAQEPAATLAQFRARCGTDAAFPGIEPAPLATDLHDLRHEDLREAARGFGAPILSIQGDADPILPAAMRDAVFAAGSHVSRDTVTGGGHLLPITHPDLCADHVLRMAEAMA